MAKADDCGCDETQEREAEYAALTVAPEDDSPDTAPDPRGTTVRAFRDQLLAPYGKPTGDKRRFKGGALTSGELPIGVKWQREDNQGHSTSVTVGAIHKVRFGDDGVYGSGVIFDPDPTKTQRWAEDCAEAYGLLKEKVIGPSVDLDDMEFHEFTDEAEEYSAEARPEIEVDRGRIRAVTLVQIPAFVEARPFALDEVDADEYAAEMDEIAALTASGVYSSTAELPVAPADYEWDLLEWASRNVADMPGAVLYDGPEGVLFPVADLVDGKLSLVAAAVADAVSMLAFHYDRVQLPDGVKDAMRERLDDLTAYCELPAPPWQHASVSLVAAGSIRDWTPTIEAFADPKLDKLTPITVRDGRVFGHLASWKSCHIGFKHCVTAPKSRSKYAHFHVGEIQTTGGPLPVGKITLGGGHADTRLGFQAAAEHYDDAGAAVAAVRAGEDKHGIWVSGVALPGAEDKFATLPLFPLSGDWRRVGGSMEMVAALAVNTPGFGVPRVHEAAGQVYALVAAGVVEPEPDEELANLFAYDPSDERVKADLTGKGKKKKRKLPPWMQKDDDEDDYAADADELAYAMQVAARRERAAAESATQIAADLGYLDEVNLRSAALSAASVF
jgi:hypothetical protein